MGEAVVIQGTPFVNVATPDVTAVVECAEPQSGGHIHIHYVLRSHLICHHITNCCCYSIAVESTPQLGTERGKHSEHAPGSKKHQPHCSGCRGHLD